MATRKDIEVLRQAKVGSKVYVSGRILYVKPIRDIMYNQTRSVCQHCFFEIRRSIVCPYLKACQSRYRNDRVSVKFTIDTKTT